jgi:hypothetical protein
MRTHPTVVAVNGSRKPAPRRLSHPIQEAGEIMRTYLSDQGPTAGTRSKDVAYGSDVDAAAPGFFHELFLGRPGESATERAARLDAASGILADLELEAPELASYATALLEARPVFRRTVVRRAASAGAAA